MGPGEILQANRFTPKLTERWECYERLVENVLPIQYGSHAAFERERRTILWALNQMQSCSIGVSRIKVKKPASASGRTLSRLTICLSKPKASPFTAISACTRCRTCPS